MLCALSNFSFCLDVLMMLVSEGTSCQNVLKHSTVIGSAMVAIKLIMQRDLLQSEDFVLIIEDYRGRTRVYAAANFRGGHLASALSPLGLSYSHRSIFC